MLQLSDTQLSLLALLKYGIFAKNTEITMADWTSVEKMANDQGVLSMLYIGAKKCKDKIPLNVIREWRGIMYSNHLHNEKLIAVQSEILDLLQNNGIRAAVLKGTSVSRYYRYPEVRCLGDIDILVDFPNLAKIRELLTAREFVEVHIGHAFHDTYEKQGVTIEIHHAVTEVPQSVGGKRAENVLQRCLDCADAVLMNDVEFPALSETHQALTLLLHMERHMTEMNIGLRQLCDWAAFVAASSNEHWEKSTLETLEYCGMLVFAQVSTKACVTYLGVPGNTCLWCLDAPDEVVDAFMRDVLQGGNLGAANTKRIGSLFTDRSILGQKKQNILKGIGAKLSSRVYFQFPIAKRFKVLLPFGCIYVGVEYLFRSLFKMPERRTIAEMINISCRRRGLIQQLAFYEIADEQKAKRN